MGKPQTEIDPFRDELRILRSALGSRIRELRVARGWSQESFAAKAHVHRTFAGSLERGEKNISFHALVLIARCFGMPVGDLLAGIETGEPAPTKRGRKSGSEVDRDLLLREIACLEASVRSLRELALHHAGKTPRATKKSERRTGRSR